MPRRHLVMRCRYAYARHAVTAPLFCHTGEARRDAACAYELTLLLRRLLSRLIVKADITSCAPRATYAPLAYAMPCHAGGARRRGAAYNAARRHISE